MPNVRFELTHNGGHIYENDIRDLERLVELGMVGIDDLIAQAVEHISNSFHGQIKVEYYAGHIIYGETTDLILEARNQILCNYGHGGQSDFPKIDRVISKIYGANVLAGPELRKLFYEEYRTVYSNVPTLNRDLMFDRIRNVSLEFHEIQQNYTPERHLFLDHVGFIFNNTDPLVL